MDPWAQNPVWQNYSSLIREAKNAQEANTGMEKSHHLAASLYFGIAALEAFINAKMRTKMEEQRCPEREILNELRKGKILSKLKDWPTRLQSKPLAIDRGTLNLISVFNEVRGDVTHPKKPGQAIYSRLESINPMSVVDSVAEYIVRFHEAEGEHYPYWIFGWNYLNPRPNSYEIILTNNDQFWSSLQVLGLSASSSQHSQPWFLGFAQYLEIKKALDLIKDCEPKWIFPFKPILCQRWWTSEHHQRCGHVTEQTLERAREYGKPR